MRWSVVFLFAWILLSETVSAQAPLLVRIPELSYRAKHLKSDEVIDRRPDQSGVGRIRVNGANRLLSLSPGVALAVQSLFENAASAGASTAGTVELVTLEVTATPSGSSISLRCDYRLRLQMNGEVLGDAVGYASVKTSGNVSDKLGPLLNKALSDALATLDRLAAEQHRSSQPESTRVIVRMGSAAEAGERAYRPGLRLGYSDFRGTPPAGNHPEAATTYSGISMDLKTESKNGSTSISIVITPNFSAAKSWMQPSGRNPHILAHEQGHLDITGIIACRLMDSLQRSPLTRDNYKTLTSSIYSHFQDAGTAMQEAYDADTDHSRNKVEQAKWQTRIEQELSALRCYE